MPAKSERNAVVTIRDEELVLQCEWHTCADEFSSMGEFTLHVFAHLRDYLLNHKHIKSELPVPGSDSPSKGAKSASGRNGKQDLPTLSTEPSSIEGEEELPTLSKEGYRCQWQDCSTDLECDELAMMRHVYFHSFHVKIKSIGALLLEKKGRPGCALDSQSRNLIPELPESLQCGWHGCHHIYENAELFYRHVESHIDCFPDGNNVDGGCPCHWEGCETRVKSRHKLKDHLRSHTQEKLVACPTCGALFSTRTKFFDHLSRQMTSDTGKRYQCSHCNKTFAAERLLRDHMRSHVNQYKCPYCDMTATSPSCIRLHISYRHTDNKPFKCDQCVYSCKAMSDLRRHTDTHNSDMAYACQVSDCEYKTRTYQLLTNHFRKEHQLDSDSYQCHMCQECFARSALLTKHLKTVHKFSWPSGHSRFRYKLHPDGKLKLETVRYESLAQSNEVGGSNVEAESEMEVGTHQDKDSVYPTACIKVNPYNTEAMNIDSHSVETHGAAGSDNGFNNRQKVEEKGSRKVKNSRKKTKKSNRQGTRTDAKVEPEKNTNVFFNFGQDVTSLVGHSELVEGEGHDSEDSSQSEEMIQINVIEGEDGKFLIQAADSALNLPTVLGSFPHQDIDPLSSIVSKDNFTAGYPVTMGNSPGVMEVVSVSNIERSEVVNSNKSQQLNSALYNMPLTLNDPVAMNAPVTLNDPISLRDKEEQNEYEDNNMYNLQMLGEVALNNSTLGKYM